MGAEFPDPRHPEHNLSPAKQVFAGFQELSLAWYSDQVLPFDITLAFTNEYGSAATCKIYAVELLNEGYGISIDDAVSEMQATFVARGVAALQAAGHRFSVCTVSGNYLPQIPGFPLSRCPFATIISTADSRLSSGSTHVKQRDDPATRWSSFAPLRKSAPPACFLSSPPSFALLQQEVATGGGPAFKRYCAGWSSGLV
jgi:hypothetical protein